MALFDKLSPVTQEIVDRASNEALLVQHDYIGTEHVLLAALHDPATLTILDGFQIDPGVVRERVLKALRLGKRPVPEHLHPLPWTSRAKRVLEASRFEASRTGAKYVAPEHLLVGLVVEEQGIAGEVLIKLGLSVEKLRSRTMISAQSEPVPEQDREVPRLLMSVEVPVWVDEDDAAEIIAEAVNALSSVHIALGGSGLVVDDIEIEIMSLV